MASFNKYFLGKRFHINNWGFSPPSMYRMVGFSIEISTISITLTWTWNHIDHCLTIENFARRQKNQLKMMEQARAATQEDELAEVRALLDLHRPYRQGE